MSTDDTASAHARRAGYDRGQYIGGPAERLTREEIEAEKAAQPRPDLCPGAALLAIGEVMAYGYGKHGRCTWRTPGTKQAEPETHIASAFRHLAKMGPAYDALDDESGLPHLHCALSQLAIAVDCIAAGDVQRIASRLAEQPSDWCPRRQCTVRACIDCGIDIEGGPTRCVACADAMGPLPESSWRYEPGAVRISPERLAELRDEVDRAGLQPEPRDPASVCSEGRMTRMTADKALAALRKEVRMLADDMERSGVRSPPGADYGTEPATFATLLRLAANRNPDA
jgi:hypothetical protein